MKFVNRKFIYLILSLLVFSMSCSSHRQSEIAANNNIQISGVNVVSKPSVKEESELERNCNLWQESKINNYKMILKLGGSGLYSPGGSIEIIIRNGEAVSIKTFEKPARNPTVESYKRFGNNTIEMMFEKIESAEKQKADKLEVKYDTKFGYPKEINIDLSSAYDDESYVKVEKFEVIY